MSLYFHLKVLRFKAFFNTENLIQSLRNLDKHLEEELIHKEEMKKGKR